MGRTLIAVRALRRTILATLGLALYFTATAAVAAPLDRLVGTWSGSGQVRYVDGRTESVKCTAYYTGGGQKLRLAIRCNSPSNKIEIRGELMQRGERLSGTWEERTFNASGQATGRLSADRLNLSIVGGGFSGAMTVSYGGSRQTVVISTEGVAMKSVRVTLVKR